MENKSHRDIWIVGTAVIVFAIWKLATLEFRFGDENVYFFMSDAVLRGLIPYRDFFFADPPFFIYLMAGFKAIFGSHIILFKTLPIIFDSASAVLIYLLLRKHNIFAPLGPIFYLFSFTVLSTSDYLTGAEVMIFLILLALFLDQRGKYFYSGIFWALACLIKLYAGPALLGFMLYKLVSRQFLPLRNIILGGLTASIVVLAPFFIIAKGQIWGDMITHHLNRPRGLNRWSIWNVFWSTQWLLLLAGLAGIFTSRNKIWVYPLIFSTVFFLLFKDLYYLYLHILIPFIVILSVEFFAYLEKKQQETSWVFLLLYAAIATYAIFAYVNIYQPQTIFAEPKEIAEALRNTPEDLPIYGSEQVTPLLALLSGKKIFNNVIDTNAQNFASGAQDVVAISKKAAESGIYLVAHTANYPKQNLQDTGFETYFDKDIFAKSCKLYKSFDRTVPGTLFNQIAIYKCVEIKK